jgi:hypothetical protein
MGDVAVLVEGLSRVTTDHDEGAVPAAARAQVLHQPGDLGVHVGEGVGVEILDDGDPLFEGDAGPALLGDRMRPRKD